MEDKEMQKVKQVRLLYGHCYRSIKATDDLHPVQQLYILFSNSLFVDIHLSSKVSSKGNIIQMCKCVRAMSIVRWRLKNRSTLERTLKES